MALKKSVRLSDETQKTCELLSKSGDVNWSGSINNITARYNVMIADVMPELSEHEKNAFVCAFNGHMLNDDIKLEAGALHWHMSEGYKYDSQIPEFLEMAGISYDDFMSKVYDFSIAERIAIIDMTQRFWNQGPKSVE